MGAMIACKLAAMVPERILSLALLNMTGGGYECIPKFNRKTLSIAMRFLKAKTPEQGAAVDLDTHYSQEYVEDYVEEKTRRSILYQSLDEVHSSPGLHATAGTALAEECATLGNSEIKPLPQGRTRCSVW